MTKKDRFVCWLPCKPYVKQFLLYVSVEVNPDDTRTDTGTWHDIPPTWRWRYAVMTSTDTDGRCRIPKWWRSAARWRDGSSRCFSSISTPMSVSESHSRPPSATFRTASALMTTPGLMRLSAGSIIGMDIGKRWRIPRF